MQLNSETPYKETWSIIPILLIFAIGLNAPINIQLHDTYIALDSISIGILLSITLGAIGFCYWLMRKKKLINWLTVIHLLTTVSSFILIVSLGLQKINDYQFAIIAVAVVSQFFFVVNLVIGLLRNKAA